MRSHKKPAFNSPLLKGFVGIDCATEQYTLYRGADVNAKKIDLTLNCSD